MGFLGEIAAWLRHKKSILEQRLLYVESLQKSVSLDSFWIICCNNCVIYVLIYCYMTTPKMSLIESYQETYGQGGGQKLRDLESMMRSMSLHVSTWFTDVYWLATACYGLLRLAGACFQGQARILCTCRQVCTRVEARSCRDCVNVCEYLTKIIRFTKQYAQ